MANEQNLKKYSEMTPKERKEFHSKGGKVSAEKKREEASMREMAKILMSLPIADPKAKGNLKQLGIEDEKMLNAMLPVLGIFKGACKGNAQDARLLAELMGENQVQGTANMEGASYNFNVTCKGVDKNE